MNREDDFSKKLREMKTEFDLSFAKEPKVHISNHEDCLIVRLENDYYALKVSEMRGIEAQKKITPLPDEKPELLGISAIQGHLAPVYSLARIMGYADTSTQPRWTVMCDSNSRIALAFDILEGYFRLPRSDFSNVDPDSKKNKEHIAEALSFRSKIGRVISLPSILKALQKGA